MNPIFVAALEVQEFCRARGHRFCFIGGLALQRWGEPRLTQDVDLTVFSGFGQEPEYMDRFLSAFAPRIPNAVAGRAQDWIDIEGIITRQHGRLDKELIWRELIPLLKLKEDERTEPRLRMLFEHGSALGNPA